MHPESYLKKERRKRKISKFRKYVTQVFIFGMSMLFFGPAIHELSHILVLFLTGCDLDLTFNFVLPLGLTGAIQPLCYLDNTESFIFYSSGHLAVLTVASILLAKYERSDNHYFAIAGTGFLLSVLFALAYRGDIFNAAEVIGLSRLFPVVFSAFLLLGVSITSLRILQKLFD